MTTSPLCTILSGSLSPVASRSCSPKIGVTGSTALLDRLNRVSGESVTVELKRRTPDGVLRPVSSSEIQRLDVTRGLDKASRLISGLGRDDRLSWCKEHCRGFCSFLNT